MMERIVLNVTNDAKEAFDTMRKQFDEENGKHESDSTFIWWLLAQARY